MKVSTVNNLICISIGWLIIILGIKYAGDFLYSNPAPEKNAYDIAGDAPVLAKKTEVKQANSLQKRLSQGNIQNGQKVFGQCALCHTPVKNGPARVGPPLWEVLGRPLASIRDFTYSRAMRAKTGKVWDFANLDIYLAAPQKMVPGTAMSFGGVKNDQDRADLILYLRSLSDKPLDLPKDDTK